MHLYNYYCWLIVVVVVVWTNIVTAAAAVVPNDSELEATAYSISQPNGNYVFGYDNVRDSKGNEHFRYEEKLANGTVVGEYGFTDYSCSIVVTVSYSADSRGFRPVVKMRRLQSIVKN